MRAARFAICTVGDLLLLVATDRISAFDYVLATGIPGKGRVLTQISLFWFDYLERYRSQSSGYRGRRAVPGGIAAATQANCLAGRCWSNRARMFPAECVVRGYLSGSGWKDYTRTGEICGIALPRECGNQSVCRNRFSLRRPRA